MKITLTWEKNYNIWTSISAFYHQIFFLSFDLSLSCKLQLIDLIMVSAACLAGWQTILVFFSLKLWVHRKRKETNGWKIRNATGRFLVQIHPSRFVSKVVCPIPNIAIEAGMFFKLIQIKWPRKDYNFQTCLRDNLVPRMLEMSFQSLQISKFSGGACPQTPLG